jgi:DNA-binding NarL/FixJ family response regulator
MILLADDHPLFRKGLKSVIENISSANIVLEAADGNEAITLSHNHDFDLVMLDYKMPGMDGYDTAKLLLENDPQRKIIIITMYNETPLIISLFRLGVKGFLMKNSEVEEIEMAIAKVSSGELYYNSIFKDLIESELASDKQFALRFSKRETEIVELLSKGRTSLEIAKSLRISQRTVDTYRYRLFNKTEVKNTYELLNYFYQNGLL